MLGSHARRIARRMQGIRRKQQPRNPLRILGCNHRTLTASVGMPSQVDVAVELLLHDHNRMDQSLLVPCCVCRTWRPERPHLPKWQITAQDSYTRFGKCGRERHKPRRIRTRPGAVREYERRIRPSRRGMQESPHRGITCAIHERFYFGDTHAKIIEALSGLRKRTVTRR
jgi:hypothetical protein